ncbi:MAG TPA: hypothetical protein VK480_00230 [Solirubrobacterales bacterium]|nr:hypothetical protein [Solirubrobacterales bacterium]
MRRLALPLALLALALTASAEQAAAKQDRLLPPLPPRHLLTQVGAPVPPERRFLSGFEVETSGPYEVGVISFGSAVMLIVSRETEDDGLTETIYLARGVATPNRLQATFGNFGRVSMRFREAQRQPRSGKRRTCRRGGIFAGRRGVFVGNLRFKGEDGYVSVRAHRAKGISFTRDECPRHRRGQRARAQGLPFLPPPAIIFASSRRGVDSTALLALRIFDRTLYLVKDEESRGKLAIVRLALGGEGDERFKVNDALTRAKISPPVPFRGTGRYSAAPDGTTTWSGNLSVNFPGVPRFPLTGPEFEAFLDVSF